MKLLRQAMYFATKGVHRGNWCRKEGLKVIAKKVVRYLQKGRLVLTKGSKDAV